MKVRASTGELTLDPIRTIEVPLEIREVESTILQMQWGEADVKGDKFEMGCGASLGSEWATIKFRGKQYCFSSNQILNAFVNALEKQADG